MMRTKLLATIGALAATVAFANTAQALPSLALVDKGGGSWYIYLTIDTDGFTSIQWNVTSNNANVGTGSGSPFLIPQADASCGATGMFNDCDFSTAGPVSNPGNPNGLNNFALFLTDPLDVVTGAPATATDAFGNSAQPIYVGYINWTSGAVAATIPLTSVQGVDGNGNAFILPEPATASMVLMGVAALAIAGRRRR